MIKQLSALLVPHGLYPRGALRLDAHEARSLNAKSLILIGHVGSSIWQHFTKWRGAQPEVVPNPLDAWSEQVIGAAADQLGGRAVFPSQKPFLPFQQWAMHAEDLKPSPLGILIHPVYGLWHAYRGAIIFDDEILIQEGNEQSHPCDLCIGKPCLSACPVGAFSGQGYDLAACKTHLGGVAGEACMNGGCLARLACPVGAEFRYGEAQMRFHMRAFAG